MSKKKRRKVVIPLSSSEGEETVFRIPDCPICAEPLSLPTVDTRCCQKQFCQHCADQWKLTGKDYSKGAQCPLCKHRPFEYKQSAAFNNLFGAREVACTNASNGCELRIPVSDLKEHLNKFCEFTLIPCSQESFGCNWAGIRSNKATHELDCMHMYTAKMRDAWEDEEQRMLTRLRKLQERCTLTEQRVDHAIQKFEGFVKEKTDELRHIQYLIGNPSSKRYVIGTKSAEHALQVRRFDSKYSIISNMMLRLVVTPNTDGYVLSIASTDPKLKYPFMLAGYVACLNQGLDSTFATSQFHFRFANSKQSVHIITIPQSAIVLGTWEKGKRQLEPIIIQMVAAVF